MAISEGAMHFPTFIRAAIGVLVLSASAAIFAEPRIATAASKSNRGWTENCSADELTGTMHCFSAIRNGDPDAEFDVIVSPRINAKPLILLNPVTPGAWEKVIIRIDKTSPHETSCSRNICYFGSRSTDIVRELRVGSSIYVRVSGHGRIMDARLSLTGFSASYSRAEGGLKGAK
jgi:hypothetical protein